MSALHLPSLVVITVARNRRQAEATVAASSRLEPRTLVECSYQGVRELAGQFVVGIKIRVEYGDVQPNTPR